MTITNLQGLTFSETWSLSYKALSKDFPLILKRSFIICFLLSFLHHSLITFPFLLLPEPLPDSLVLTEAVIDALVSMLLVLFYLVVVTHRVQLLRGKQVPHSLGTYLKQHLKLLTIESLRTLLPILLYSLLLLIPGLIKSVQLQFVPFIVLLHKRYQEGKIDALKKSEELVKGSLAALFLFYIITQVILLLVVLGAPSLLQKLFLYEDRSLTYFIVDFLFKVPIGLVLELAISLAVFNFYVELVKRKEGENELAI